MSKQTSLTCDVFTRRVMGRIYVVYFLRKLSRPVFIESFLLGLCTLIISLMVSLGHVINNAERVPDAPMMLPLFRFFWSAFLDTNDVVKILSIALVLTAIMFVYTISFSLFKRCTRISGRLLGQIFFRHTTAPHPAIN